MVLQTFRERGSQIFRSLCGSWLHSCLSNFKQHFFFYSAGADRVQILELCVTSGVRPSDKIGGRPAGPSPWVVNHRKVILADKDAVHFGQECYISDVPRMLLFPFLGLENGVQLDSPGSMKPTKRWQG